jgi:hypothetical protein
MFSVVMSRLQAKAPGMPTAKSVLRRLQLFPVNIMYYHYRNTVRPHFYTILTTRYLRSPCCVRQGHRQVAEDRITRNLNAEL